MRNGCKRVAIVVLTAVLLASPVAGQRPRIDRLEQWMAIVNRHEPGVLDDAVEEVTRWDAVDLRGLWIDLTSLISLVREPSVLTLYTPNLRVPRPQVVRAEDPFLRQGSATNPPKVISYGASDLRRLRELALALAGHGRENALLKRGAMLHADVEMLDPVSPRGRGGEAGLERISMRIDDGRQTGLVSIANHWAFARLLLDRVNSPDRSGKLRGPESDQTVRMWYVASAAFMQATGSLDPEHLDRALEIFPKDSEVLFFGATLHEVLAGPRRQSVFRGRSVQDRIAFRIWTEGEELGIADRLYRRAIDVDPEAIEARIRYGHVLAMRGRHTEAVTELTKVRMPSEPLLQYYQALFLGGEFEALGRDDDARRAYERAAALFPRAQSPRLGLSRLNGTSEQRQPSRAALLALLADDDDREDPWWTYERAPARGVDELRDRLHAAVAKEPK